MSSFLQNLVTDAATVVEPVLASLSQSATVQTLEKYTLQVILAIELKQTPFVVGPYTVKASVNGVPSSLNLASAFHAIAAIESGSVGTFQVGDIVVSVEPTVAAQVPPALPENPIAG